jgi:hypothetical protein
MLKSIVVWFTWIWAVVFVPIETYLSWWSAPPRLSAYVVNVFGVGLMLWGIVSLRRGRPYAEGVLATGWGWMTAVFWRGANLRYWLAVQGKPLSFGRLELWLGPVFTIIAGSALAGSLVLLLNENRHRQSEG